MQQAGDGSTDARSVIEQALALGGPAMIDRQTSAVVQRYVELQMGRGTAPVRHRHPLPARPAVRVQARIDWSRFVLVSTTGSGVGAAAVVGTDGWLVELTTVAALTGQVIPCSHQEGEAVLRVLVGARHGLIDELAKALAGS